jgi:hypothetical protein
MTPLAHAEELGVVPLPNDRAVEPKKEVIIPFNVIASSLAVVLACVALGLHFLHTPPALGKGLAAYDLSTPAAASKSEIMMMANQDIRAMFELQSLLEGRSLQEQLTTLKIDREREWGGRVILFVSFLKNGIRHYDTKAFQKDARTGLWTPKGVSSYSVKASDPSLAEAMEQWEAQGPSRPTFSSVSK